jgi:hypothetical protein
MKESSQLGTQSHPRGNGDIPSNEQKLCLLQKLLQCMDLSDLSEDDRCQLQLRIARFSTSTLART